MTKLIVTPIDMAAPRSFAQRKSILHAIADLRRARESENVEEMVAVFDALEGVVRDHLETDDETTVDEALAMCSANEFDALFSGLISGETIPNPSDAS